MYNEEDQTYTAAEVMLLLKISYSTLYRLRKAGKLKSVIIGYNLVRYPKKEVDALLKGKATV